MNVAAIALLALIFIQQDSSQLPDFTYFFPDDIYIDLDYSSIDLDAPGLAVYRDCADPKLAKLYHGSPFGGELRQMIRQMATGKSLRDQVAFYNNERMMELRGGGSVGGVKTPDGFYSVKESRVFMWHSLQSPTLFLRKALETGAMRPCGENIGEAMVYLVQPSESVQEKGVAYYGFFTETGDLLLSSNLDGLRRMHVANTGEIPCLADNSFYTEVLVDSNLYGTTWSLFNGGAVNQAVLEAMEARGESAEARASLEKEIAGASMELYGYVIGKNLTRYSVMFCSDRKIMEESISDFKSNMDQASVFENSGTRLIERLEYNELVTERERKKMLELTKMWQKRQESQTAPEKQEKP